MRYEAVTLLQLPNSNSEHRRHPKQVKTVAPQLDARLTRVVAVIDIDRHLASPEDQDNRQEEHADDQSAPPSSAEHHKHANTSHQRQKATARSSENKRIPEDSDQADPEPLQHPVAVLNDTVKTDENRCT